jgi:hypothetical protein
VQLLLPSRRVLMEKRCHHVVIECLPLRMLGCLLPRTSENPQNANFALTEFSEVRLDSSLGSSLAATSASAKLAATKMSGHTS